MLVKQLDKQFKRIVGAGVKPGAVKVIVAYVPNMFKKSLIALLIVEIMFGTDML